MTTETTRAQHTPGLCGRVHVIGSNVVILCSGIVQAGNVYDLIAAAPAMLEFVRIVDLAMTGGPNKADIADLRRRARAILARIEGTGVAP